MSPLLGELGCDSAPSVNTLTAFLFHNQHLPLPLTYLIPSFMSYAEILGPNLRVHHMFYLN